MARRKVNPRLARRRGEVMKMAGDIAPGGMAAILGLDIPIMRIIMFSTSLVLMAALYFFIQKTKIGTAIRAAAISLEAPESSALAGENAFLKSLVQNTVALALDMQPPQEPAAPSGLIAAPGETGLIRR